jgi:hypothetical protein
VDVESGDDRTTTDGGVDVPPPVLPGVEPDEGVAVAVDGDP